MDKVTICNMALGHIRSASIADLSENSQEAEYCALYYDTARRAVLEAFNWNFARRRLALTLLTTYDDDTKYGFKYRYQYPSDCLKARYIPKAGSERFDRFHEINHARYEGYNRDGNVKAIPAKFEVALSENGQERTILTDEPDAWLIYTVDMENTNLFTYEFVIMFSWMLAALLGTPVGGGDKDYKKCMDAYSSLLPDVMANNANEEDNPPPEEMNEFVASRY